MSNEQSGVNSKLKDYEASGRSVKSSKKFLNYDFQASSESNKPIIKVMIANQPLLHCGITYHY